MTGGSTATARLLRGSALAYGCAHLLGLPVGDCFVGTAAAQTVTTGSIRGTVTEQGTGIALAGAQVHIKDSDRRTTTDRSGGFALEGLSAGSYTVEVEYLGLPKAAVDVTVTAGPAIANVAVSAAGTDHDVVVTAVVNDRTKKLNQERSAAALTEIAASSTAAEFPDRNLGEVLQRLTGVFIDRNGTGEGNVLLIRGISSVNNLVLVEGLRLPSGRPDGRTPNLATINSDVIESVEVRKVFTPEIPADFFGGYLNSRQISAYDRNRPFLSASLSTARRDITTHGWDVEGSAKASTLLADGRIGIAAAFGYDRRDASFQQYNASRSANDATGVPAGTPTVFQYRSESSQIERYSGNAQLEFRPSESNRFYVRGFYNYGKESVVDPRLNVYLLPAFAAGSTPITGRAANYSPELELIAVQRPERFFSVVAGNDNTFGDWGLSYFVGYNQLRSRQDNQVRFGARSATRTDGATYDFTREDDPTLVIGTPSLLSTASTYGTVVAPSTNLAAIRENQYIGQLDLSRRVEVGSGDVTFRVGGRYDLRKRGQDVGGTQTYANIANASSYIIPGPTGVYRGQFDIPLQLDANALVAAFPTPSATKTPGDVNYLASIAGDYSARDRIYAAYGMVTVVQGPLQIIAGGRYERTESSGSNYVINRNQYAANPLTGVTLTPRTASYSRFLPALVLKVQDDKVLVRASVTKTYARPTLSNLFGGETVTLATGNDRNVSRGNPALTPQDAWNYDVSIDYYGGNASVLRLGLYYKDISKVFYTGSTTAANPNGGTDFITQPLNGGAGSVMGIEAGAIQGLTFLPGPLARLSVELNGGASWSRQDVLNASGQVIRHTDLQDSYGFIGNASLVYRARWGVSRIAYRYASTRLLAIDTNASGGYRDGFRAPSSGLDADLSINLLRDVGIFAEARNLLKQTEVVEYLGTRGVTTRAQYSGRSFGAGVRLNF